MGSSNSDVFRDGIMQKQYFSLRMMYYMRKYILREVVEKNLA